MPRHDKYFYHPPAAGTPIQTQKDIVNCFTKWRVQAHDEKVIGLFDFPHPRLGAVEATARFVLRGSEVLVRCEYWDDYNVNFKCVYLAIDSMRLNEARGIADTMREAYAALPAPAKHRDPWEVLGVRSDAPWEDVEDMYKIKARRFHPDTGKDGGDAKVMGDLNIAFDAIKAERGK